MVDEDILRRFNEDIINRNYKIALLQFKLRNPAADSYNHAIASEMRDRANFEKIFNGK